MAVPRREISLTIHRDNPPSLTSRAQSLKLGTAENQIMDVTWTRGGGSQTGFLAVIPEYSRKKTSDIKLVRDIESCELLRRKLERGVYRQLLVEAVYSELNV